MASSPQQRDPRNDPSNDSRNDANNRQTGPVLNTQRRVEREVGTGGIFSLWWVWIPVAIAVFWFVGWGFGPWGGWWFGHGPASTTHSAAVTQPVAPAPSQTSSAAPPNGNTSPAGGIVPGSSAKVYGPATGTGLAVLESADKVSFLGQPFNVDDVQVLKKAGNRAFFIGTPTAAAAGNATYASSMLLLLPSDYQQGLHAGEYVDVRGTVRKAPSASQAKKMWHLTSGSASQLEINKAYIQGANVTAVQP